MATTALPSHHPFRSPMAKEVYLAHYARREKAWPLASENRTVETDFGPTFVRVSGPADAPPLVLLPGAGTSSLVWKGSVAALSAAHRTYAVDNVYDVGRSVYTRPIKTAGDYVAWLDSLFTGLSLERGIRLMGGSYGAFLTAHYALARPERLDRAVLVAPAGVVLPIRLRWMLRAMAAPLHPSLQQSFFDWIFEDLRKTSEGQTFIEELTEDNRLNVECYKQKLSVIPRGFSDEDLARIAVPTLVVLGEHETLYSASEAVARLRRVAPRIETGVIPGGGHDVAQAQTARFEAAVLEFLRR